jgi:DnaJ-class molecular chaperone
MIFLDYYKILGIDNTATPKDIKNAYRKLARKYHPDLNPNDKDAKKNFQQINEANEGHFGDLYVTYAIKIPTNLTDKQKVLFTELSKS